MIKITGLNPTLRRLAKIQAGIDPIIDESMKLLMEDVVDQAMENLRNRLMGTSTTRGDEKTHIKLADNLDLWEYEEIKAGGVGFHQFKLWNRSDHAAPVECGSRTPILPKGDFLYLGNNIRVKEVKGQEPKHFLGDALYYQRDRWAKNLARYTRTRINSLIR